MRLDLAEVIGVLLLSGPDRVELRLSWVLHQTLRNLAVQQGSVRDVLPVMQLIPTPDIGSAVEGVGASLHYLADDGLFRVMADHEAGAVLEVDRNRIRPYLKLLMSMEPEVADAFYCAGTAWRALTSTSAKIFDKDRESASPMSLSATPKWRQLPAGVTR